MDNNKEALALENNLIKQYKPRFNILLRDDKTYPYIRLTNEKFPRVYVTRRIFKDGSTYYGPYFPGNLAHRLVHFIHRHFKVPSCKIDFSRKHTHPCLQYHIHRCLGPCVDALTTEQAYAAAVRDVRLFLEGRHHDLARELETRMESAAEQMRFEEAASLRNLVTTVRGVAEKQKMAAAEGENIDIFAYYAEAPLIAVNLFHLRNGRIVDRREFFWEDQHDFEPAEFFGALLKQVYLNQQYVPSLIHVPMDFEDREELEELLSEKRGRRLRLRLRSAAQKSNDGARRNECEAQLRPALPRAEAILESHSEAVQDALNLPEPPKRIECFDISHIQGTDKVASMVVWEDGRMKKSDYRKFIIRTVEGNDDFASMREVITRRYSRLQEEKTNFLIWYSWTAALANCTQRRMRWSKSASPISRSRPSPNAKSGSTSTGRKTSRSFSDKILADPPSGPNHPRRGTSFRRHIPPNPAKREQAHVRTARGSWRWPEDSGKIAPPIWQPRTSSRSDSGTTIAKSVGTAAAKRVLRSFRSTGRKPPLVQIGDH